MNNVVNKTSILSTEICEEYRSKPIPSKYEQLDFDIITKVAEECLQKFKDVNKHKGSLSLRGRVEAYRNLSKGLRKVANHIHGSKSLWQKFLSIFSPLSAKEKRFQKVHSAVNRALNSARSKEHRLWVGESLVLRFFNLFGLNVKYVCKKTLNTHRESLRGRVKAAAFRVLGDNAINSKQIDGEDPYNAVRNIQNDIRNFIAEMKTHLTNKQLANLGSINENLEKASLLLLDLSVVRLFGKLPDIFAETFDNLPNIFAETSDKRQERVKDIAKMVRQRIENLLPQQNMIIPGGYGCKQGGHAVIYNVRKELNGKFTFTIVNTGAGLGHFSGFFSNLYSQFSEKYHDYEIPNLTLDDVANEEFLEKMLDVPIKDDGSVKKMYEPILKYLAKNNEANIVKGRYHWSQKNGTCAHDSVICWMESMMDPQLFQALLLFMTKKGLMNLKDLTSSSKNGGLSNNELGNEEKFSPYLLEKVKSFGEQTFKVRKDQFVELHKKANQTNKDKFVELEKEYSTLKGNTELVSNKLEKWKVREQPFYLKLLEDKVKLLKHKYCLAAGIENIENCQSPYSFFGFSAPNKEVASAWEAYEAKVKEYKKMKASFAKDAYQEKIRQKVGVLEKKLLQGAADSVSCQLELKELKDSQKGLFSIYQATSK